MFIKSTSAITFAIIASLSIITIGCAGDKQENKTNVIPSPEPPQPDPADQVGQPVKQFTAQFAPWVAALPEKYTSMTVTYTGSQPQKINYSIIELTPTNDATFTFDNKGNGYVSMPVTYQVMLAKLNRKTVNDTVKLPAKYENGNVTIKESTYYTEYYQMQALDGDVVVDGDIVKIPCVMPEITIVPEVITSFDVEKKSKGAFHLLETKVGSKITKTIDTDISGSIKGSDNKPQFARYMSDFSFKDHKYAYPVFTVISDQRLILTFTNIYTNEKYYFDCKIEGDLAEGATVTGLDRTEKYEISLKSRRFEISTTASIYVFEGKTTGIFAEPTDFSDATVSENSVEIKYQL